MKTKKVKRVLFLKELQEEIRASFAKKECNKLYEATVLIKTIIYSSCEGNGILEVGLLEDIKLAIWYNYSKYNDLL